MCENKASTSSPAELRAAIENFNHDKIAVHQIFVFVMVVDEGGPTNPSRKLRKVSRLERGIHAAQNFQASFPGIMQRARSNIWHLVWWALLAAMTLCGNIAGTYEFAQLARQSLASWWSFGAK